MTVVELGAGASGFQFVLSRMGMRVISMDPLVNPDNDVDWRFSENDHDKLNCALGCNVEFVRKYLHEVRLPAESIDRVFAISVIEHITEHEACQLLREVKRILKPGGYFVATIDLFLDLEPFSSKKANTWGRNVSVRALVESSGLSLQLGNVSELLGYPQFNPKPINSYVDELLVCDSIASQCIVLEKDHNIATEF
jgi:2-polyprenyl-3-methyl-5-hydroxy-6-metoxy-1,4-benzoquinol methylase